MEANTDKSGNRVSDEAARQFICAINAEDVLQVYSGRQGCMCGCLGKYSINPAHKAEADKDRGYETDIGGGMRMVNKVLRLLRADNRTLIQDGYILYIPREHGEARSYVLYLRKDAAL